MTAEKVNSSSSQSSRTPPRVWKRTRKTHSHIHNKQLVSGKKLTNELLRSNVDKKKDKSLNLSDAVGKKCHWV